MAEPHVVPLSHQAVAILRGLHPLTGGGRYVFGVARPMSESTINSALRRLGYDKDTMTGHGVRAMARTILDEVLGERPDFIEHQLAHAVRDPLGRAYNRTKHLPERRRMMQRWADYLDGLKNGAEWYRYGSLGRGKAWPFEQENTLCDHEGGQESLDLRRPCRGSVVGCYATRSGGSNHLGPARSLRYSASAQSGPGPWSRRRGFPSPISASEGVFASLR